MSRPQNRANRVSYNQRQIAARNSIQPLSRSQNASSSLKNTTDSHNQGLFRDELIKIDKILTLLNERLRAVEERTLNSPEVTNNTPPPTTVTFDNLISLDKMNSIFSLLDSRISTLENKRDFQELSIDVTANKDTMRDKITSNITGIKELEQKHETLDDEIKELNKAIKNININGISNNFIKLNSLIQTTKTSLQREINKLKITSKTANVKSATTYSDNVTDDNNDDDNNDDDNNDENITNNDDENITNNNDENITNNNDENITNNDDENITNNNDNDNDNDNDDDNNSHDENAVNNVSSNTIKLSKEELKLEVENHINGTISESSDNIKLQLEEA